MPSNAVPPNAVPANAVPPNAAPSKAVPPTAAPSSAVPPDTGPPRDLILQVTGSFGKYQLWLCCIIFFSKFFIAFNQLAIIFYNPPMKYTCADNDKPNFCPCEKPIYDTSVFTSTIVTEWNLICKRKWKANFLQTIFQAGTLIGSLLFGAVSDRFGRRIPFIIVCVMQCVFGIAGSFIPSYELFVLFRLIVGMSVGGSMVVGFVIIMEFIGPEYREVISALYQIPFNLGHVLLPVISYFLRAFRDFNLAISLPTVVFAIYFYSLPETPRWLIAKQHTEKAIAILTHTAKMNKLPTEHIRGNVEAFHAIQARSKVEVGTLIDLFRTPNIRKNIMGMAMNWMSCSYCYYGVSQYVGKLGGNIFINVLIVSTLVTCSTLMSIPMMKVFGRKTIVLGCHATCAVSFVILGFFSQGIVSIVSASIGVMAAFTIFVVVYLYCGEMFPTVVRSAAMGFSSMCARIGSMIAPMVIDLDDFHPILPPLAFAVLPFITFFLTLLLPETKGIPLLTTIEQGEALGKKITVQTSGTPAIAPEVKT